MRTRHLAVLGSLAATLLAGCSTVGRGAPKSSQPMPDIPAYELTPTENAGMAIVRTPGKDPLSGLGATKLISLNARDADAKTLLLWLAREGGVSLIVAPDVNARVSVNFSNVPAGEAMRAIMAEAGLSVLSSGVQSPWPPIVFFQVPTNINEATADAIASRFGVSAEMAKWIVENRPKP